MRKITAVVAVPALMLALSATWAATVTINDEIHHNDAATLSQRMLLQSQMFDGIKLTEQQRQQLRDLMQQARYDHSPISINDLEQLHELIIADKFDDAAYQAQVEKIAQADVVHQLMMARIRNQMYHLLTQQQQDVIKQRCQQRMNELRRLANMPRSSPQK